MKIKQFAGRRFLSLLLFSVLASCAEPTDPQTGALLAKMSERDDIYFASLIRSHGTEKCRASSAESRKYWVETNADMRVVVARISALGQLDDNLDDVTSLQNNYKQAQALMEARETSPNGTDYCLAPDTVANLWVRISRLNALIGENVTFE